MRHAVSVRKTCDGWESTGIDWSDLGRMGTDQRVTLNAYRDAVPEFAMSDLKLRLVIKEMDRRNTEFGGRGSTEFTTHRKNVRRFGSYPAMLAAIAYRAWRLGYDSPTVADEMSINPVVVRRYLYRMTVIAKELAANGWKLFVPEYVEGEICFYCRKRPVNKARCKWCCDDCQDEVDWRKRIQARRRRARIRRAAARENLQ